jgi:choice-of-anchor B domain-containing protein
MRMIRPTALGLLLLSAAGGTALAAPGPDRLPAGQQVFGLAVAMSGDQAFVGEPTSSKGASGVVHVYRRGAAGWTASSVLSVAGLPDAAAFGVSLAADGGTLLVGMRADSTRGGVRIFTRGTSGAWTDAGALPASPAARDQFGAAVALAGDWAYVGAPNEGTGGAVHVYRKSGGSWSQVGALPAKDLAAGDGFGSALSVDGDRIAVSAPGKDATKGMVLVFRRGADGSWAQEAALAGRRVPATSRLGTAVLLAGDKLYAGAPNANGFAGMVVGFSRTGEDWAEAMTLAPFEVGANRFGIALAKVGDELWIGAPFSDGREGRIYRAMMNADGALTGMVKLAADSLHSGSQFGEVLAVQGGTAVVGMPRDVGNAGTVTFLSRSAQGAWRTTGIVFPAPQEMAAVTGREVRCDAAGKAGEFECGNASLLSYLPVSKVGGRRGSTLNDNWGWTDPQGGREYALVGRSDGTSFVDVTDPANPRYLGDLPLTKGANPNVWRDIKTYKNHAFIVADGAGPHGMQVFDLTRLRTVKTPQTFTEDAHYSQIGSAHNIVINEGSGYAYAVGVSGSGETCGGGLHMIDIRNPTSPTFAGCFSDPQTGRAGTGYSHDAQCVMYTGPDAKYRGREICVGSNETAISIADVTDKKAPKALSNASYPAVGYAHQGWLTEDQRYFYLGDELDEGAGQEKTRTMIFDLANLEDPVLVKQWFGTTPATDHNMYVKGTRLYQSNYQAGLRILDIADPANPREVGFLDTTPEGTTNQMSGNWSNYPYFKSGTIVVTSVGEGLFLVRDRTQAVP